MTTNPYAPPVTDSSQAAPPLSQKSFARRTSFVLAAVGFAFFWGAVAYAIAHADESASPGSSEIAAGFGVLLGVVAHLVGIGVVFAAPRGRRLVPALLNGVSLAIMIAIVVYGLGKAT